MPPYAFLTLLCSHSFSFILCVLHFSFSLSIWLNPFLLKITICTSLFLQFHHRHLKTGDPSPQNHVLVSQGFNSKFEKPDWSSLSQVFPSSPVSCGRGTGVTLHLNLLERDRSLRRQSRETETIWQQIAKNKQTKKKTPPKVCFPPEKKKWLQQVI